MKRHIRIAFATVIIGGFLVSNLFSDAGPFDGKNFRGRIAYSADGNHNDPDDWAASPVVHLEFYNDATDVERMGWKLDQNRDLHHHEKRMFEGIVNRFKHRKNIIWGIEESINKLPRARTPHFMKLSELIARHHRHQGRPHHKIRSAHLEAAKPHHPTSAFEWRFDLSPLFLYYSKYENGAYTRQAD